MKKSGYKSIAKVAEEANLYERTIVKYIKGKSDNINNYAFKCVCDVLNIPRNDFNIPYIRTEDLTDQVGKNMPKRYYPLKQDKIRENTSIYACDTVCKEVHIKLIYVLTISTRTK